MEIGDLVRIEHHAEADRRRVPDVSDRHHFGSGREAVADAAALVGHDVLSIDAVTFFGATGFA